MFTAGGSAVCLGLLCLLSLVLICCVVDFVRCVMGVGYGWYSRFGLGGFLGLVVWGFSVVFGADFGHLVVF